MQIRSKPILIERRIRAGFSRKEMSSQIGITTQGYRNIEVDKHGVNPGTAKKITMILETDFDDIFELRERG